MTARFPERSRVGEGAEAVAAAGHTMFRMSSDRRASGAPFRLASDGRASWRPGRLASVVVEELAHQIIGGAFSAGDILPTEPALCEQFGFSRTVVREGVKLLEERGLVRVEQGRGTSVQPRDAWNLLDPVVIRIALEYDADMSLLDSLMTVRRVLERDMTRAAAARLTEADLVALAENIELMESAYEDYERFRASDLAFHAIVMKASGNEVGLTIVRSIHRHGGATPPLSSATSRALLERTVDDHRAIYDALAAGDGERAGELISTHIETSWAERKSDTVAT
jgi:DNA-binding FadR family transcriptional regulator